MIIEAQCHSLLVAFGVAKTALVHGLTFVNSLLFKFRPASCILADLNIMKNEFTLVRLYWIR